MRREAALVDEVVLVVDSVDAEVRVVDVEVDSVLVADLVVASVADAGVIVEDPVGDSAVVVAEGHIRLYFSIYSNAHRYYKVCITNYSFMPSA